MILYNLFERLLMKLMKSRYINTVCLLLSGTGLLLGLYLCVYPFTNFFRIGIFRTAQLVGFFIILILFIIIYSIIVMQSQKLNSHTLIIFILLLSLIALFILCTSFVKVLFLSDFT